MMRGTMGETWCCVRPGFVDLQESQAGFGASMDQSFEDLKQNEFEAQVPENWKHGKQD